MKKYFLYIVLFLIVFRIALLGFGYTLGQGTGMERFKYSWVNLEADPLWYNKIATVGYDRAFPPFEPSAVECHLGQRICLRNFAFFPLYPMLIVGVRTVTGLDNELSGILISNIAVVLTGIYLYKLALALFNKRVALYSVVAFSFYPIAYIFSGLMTESTFILLFVSAYYYAYKKKWLLAGFLGLLLSATRNTGFLFIIPYILLYWEQNKLKFDLASLKHLDKRSIVGLCMIPLGLVMFMGYLWYWVGDPLAFAHIQIYWGKPVYGLNPVFATVYSFFNYIMEGNLRIHLFNVLNFCVLMGLFVLSWRKKILPASLSTIMLWIFIPLATGTMLALPRYISVLFPLYLVLGYYTAKFKYLGKLILIASLIFLLVLTRYYVIDAWITV